VLKGKKGFISEPEGNQKFVGPGIMRGGVKREEAAEKDFE